MNSLYDVRRGPDFAALVAELEWPLITAFGGQVRGRAAWGALLPRLGRPERITLLRRLRRHVLFGTKASRERWSAWRRAGSAIPPRPHAARLAWCAHEVYLVGDAVALPMIADVLADLPDAVADTAIREAAFVAVGLDSTAWCGGADFETYDGRRLASMIALGPAISPDLVRHEVGHVWFSRRPHPERPRPAMTVQGTAGLLQYAADLGCASKLTDDEAKSERLANAFAVAFGPADRP